MSFIPFIFPKGCELMFIPAAYEERFGPWLWELSQRSRACDNQLFVVAISPAKNPKANYVCYGHSMAVDPCGTIITEAGSGEEIVCTELGRQFLIFSDLNRTYLCFEYYSCYEVRSMKQTLISPTYLQLFPNVEQMEFFMNKNK